jgi:photosystem II stability/assembly factor-like uncharacterized protein
MRSIQFKILLGGLAVLLAVLACSTASLAIPTIPAATDTASPVPATAAPTIPATAAPTIPATTDTASPVPATATPTIPLLPVASSPSIQSLYMLDVNNGWALTDTGVVRTSDGGTTWYDATPAGLNGAPANPFFLDATTGWLAAGTGNPTTGTLYHTNDGGATWTSTTVPFGGGSINFIDPMHGWELVGLSAGMSHEAVAIFRTNDGGVTWSQVFINDPSVSGSTASLPLVGDKNGIIALDNNHAWVTGSQPSSDFIYIYASQDGGTTWAHQNLAIPSVYSGAMTGASLPVFFGSSDAVLPVLLFANNNGTDFFVSHDGGQTWSASAPVAQGGFLAVASATDFFVWDGNAPLNVSHDAGVSWSTVTPNVNIKDNMVSMQFVNATTGWALTSDANNHRMLYKTMDGGANWTVLIP